VVSFDTVDYDDKYSVGFCKRRISCYDGYTSIDYVAMYSHAVIYMLYDYG
jgi:hypothetical protein